MDKRELEREICRKYKRLTGVEPTGLIDTLHILAGPDMSVLMQTYMDMVHKGDSHNATQSQS